MPSFRIVGPGRAGRSLQQALVSAGWEGLVPIGRGDPLAGAAEGVDVLVIATRDPDIASVAAAVRPVPTTTVVHLAGALGTAVLEPHPRRAAVHPLVAFPDPDTGAARLAAGAWFGVTADGDVLDTASALVGALGGRLVTVDESSRALYHAAACAAANHMVALMAHVQELGRGAGVELAAFLDLARANLDNVAERGPAAALTGPVARGDWPTVLGHLAAMPEAERRLYRAMAERAAHLAGRNDLPWPHG
ncbi:MAG TPA: DUF2520 domain-containing protein [Acidimicrobiales bacterium]|nr:DUF2520 domain-containing protein [Acidimicrobiales bacterium]